MQQDWLFIITRGFTSPPGRLYLCFLKDPELCVDFNALFCVCAAFINDAPGFVYLSLY